MALFWVHKRQIIIFLLVLQIIFYSGCDAYYSTNKYPYQKKGCWYCEEIDLTLDYRNGLEDAAGKDETITWNGNVLFVSIGYRANIFSIGLLPEEPNAPISSELIGRWGYQDENIVVIVEQDEIFGSAFEMLEFIRIG